MNKADNYDIVYYALLRNFYYILLFLLRFVIFNTFKKKQLKWDSPYIYLLFLRFSPCRDLRRKIYLSRYLEYSPEASEGVL